MPYQYGMQGNTGLPPKAVQSAVGMSPDFPVVGNGLGGLPVRSDSQQIAKNWIGITKPDSTGGFPAINASVRLGEFIYNAGYLYGKALVQKTDLSGNLIWAKLFSAPTGDANLFGIATDATGYIFCCGAVNQRAFVVKLSDAGGIEWQQFYGPTSSNFQFRDVAVDSSGSVYVVGSVFTTQWEASVVKFNSAGAVQWRKRLGGSGRNIYGYGVVVDSSGNVCVQCQANQAVDPYYEEVIVVKINTSGTQLNQSAFRGPSNARLSSQNRKNIYTDGISFYFAADVYTTSVVFVKLSSTLGTTFVKAITTTSNWPLIGGVAGFADGSCVLNLSNNPEGNFVLPMSTEGLAGVGTKYAVTNPREFSISAVGNDAVALLGAYVDAENFVKPTSILLPKDSPVVGTFGDFTFSSPLGFVSVASGSLAAGTTATLNNDTTNTATTGDASENTFAFTYSKIKIA